MLKGANTVITDGAKTYVNPVSSSALAKAGSGDVLAGLLAALVAHGGVEPTEAAALAVYYHSLAGVSLAERLSDFGITTSDLPLEIARHIAATERERST